MIALAAIATLLAAAPTQGGRHRARPDAEANVWRVRETQSARRVSYSHDDGSCPSIYGSCNAGNNLLTSMDLADASWTAYGSVAAAPTVSALASTTIDGETVSYNRVQFAAVVTGESTVYANVSSGACKKIYCTYSIYLRSHAGASVSSGNLPIGTAELGSDGQGYQMCPFTSSWSRCVLTVPSQASASFSFFWIGYVANQSGASAALDLDLALPKAELGAGGATAAQCPSPLQTPAYPHTGYVQGNITADWGLTSRDGAGMLRVAGGDLVLMGGWRGTPQSEWSNDGGANVTTNQVFRSTNNGATWSAILAHADDPPQTGAGQRWRRRHSACWLLATISGTEYLYVIGGDGFDDAYNGTGDGTPPYPSDVWRSESSTYGATWERMTATAEWGSPVDGGIAPDGGQVGRVLHSCWANSSGHLFVAGGQTCLLSGCASNDVWRSTNGGASWSRLANAGWSARGSLASSAPVANGSAYIYGGQQYDSDPGQRNYFNDAWAFDGTNWTRTAADAGFTPRGYHSLLSFNGRLWALKGFTADGNTNDIWSSADGVCWRPERARAGSAEHAAGATVSADGGSIIITNSVTSGSVWEVRAP